jgi:hypothetical protein
MKSYLLTVSLSLSLSRKLLVCVISTPSSPVSVQLEPHLADVRKSYGKFGLGILTRYLLIGLLVARISTVLYRSSF